MDEEDALLALEKAREFDEAFKLLQSHPTLASKSASDHLMARAFKHQMKLKKKDAFWCAKWSLAISYGLQMGPDGINLFFRKFDVPGAE